VLAAGGSGGWILYYDEDDDNNMMERYDGAVALLFEVQKKLSPLSA
jgi:hypothetical protein